MDGVLVGKPRKRLQKYFQDVGPLAVTKDEKC